MFEALLLFLLALVLAVCLYVGYRAFRQSVLPTLVWGAPYLPTHQELVKIMIRLARLQPTDRVVDLGSGDGRIVIAAAQARVRSAIGYEIDSMKVKAARTTASQLALTNASFEATSFWKVSLREADVVFVYTLPPYLPRIQKKLSAELRPGARVVTLLAKLPGWTPLSEEEDVRVYQIK